MPSKLYKSKRHDTGSRPVVDLDAPVGVAWDLETDGVTIKFIARLPDALAPKMNAAPVVTGPWQVRFDPEPEDVDTIGAYDVEVEVTPPDGLKVTFPTDDPGEPEALVWRIGTDLDDA